MFSKALGAILCLFSFSSYALETDNFVVWDKELKDISHELNQYLEQEINYALKKSNNKRYVQSCKQVTMRIAKRFRAMAPITHPMEDWIKKNLGEGQIYPLGTGWIRKSIYKYPHYFYLKKMPLASNVRVGEFYFGTDKLSHFTSTGRRYLARYLKLVQKGYSDVEAQKSAIHLGLNNEATFLGSWSSGVFSYGDMEANYQGFLFYRKMCMNESENYLSQKENGSWTLVKSPDIRDYVSAYWDETFNRSFRLAKSWRGTKRALKEGHCSPDFIELGARRMEHYRSFPHTSFSLEYIKELQDKGYHRAPVPPQSQELEEVCRNEAVIEIAKMR